MSEIQHKEESKAIKPFVTSLIHLFVYYLLGTYFVIFTMNLMVILFHAKDVSTTVKVIIFFPSLVLIIYVFKSMLKLENKALVKGASVFGIFGAFWFMLINIIGSDASSLLLFPLLILLAMPITLIEFDRSVLKIFVKRFGGFLCFVFYIIFAIIVFILLGLFSTISSDQKVFYLAGTFFLLMMTWTVMIDRPKKEKLSILVVSASMLIVPMLSLSIMEMNRNVFVDKEKKLLWQDTEDASSMKLNWSDASDYCQTLVIDQNSHWTLPTKGQLETLFIHKNRLKNIVPDTYWSSTVLPNKKFAWRVHFQDSASPYGKSFYGDKSEERNVRCVSGRN